jgi:ABC-type multidrug transport system permease subunit
VQRGDQELEPQSSSARITAIVIGAFFVLCALWIFYAVPGSNIAGLVCGAVILLLGIEALVSAVRRRPSWLSKIGPLP